MDNLSKISHEKIWSWIRKENFKRETESLLITAENKLCQSKDRHNAKEYQMYIM